MARKLLATLRQAVPRPLQEAGERQESALQWDLALCKPPGGKAAGHHKGACWDLWGTAFKPLWEDSANAKANAKRQDALQALAEGPGESFGDLQKRLQVALGFPWQASWGAGPKPPPSLESCFQAPVGRQCQGQCKKAKCLAGIG